MQRNNNKQDSYSDPWESRGRGRSGSYDDHDEARSPRKSSKGSIWACRAYRVHRHEEFVGKTFKSSKIKITWTFVFTETVATMRRAHRIVLKHSKTSNSREVWIDGELRLRTSQRHTGAASGQQGE